MLYTVEVYIPTRDPDNPDIETVTFRAPGAHAANVGARRYVRARFGVTKLQSTVIAVEPE